MASPPSSRRCPLIDGRSTSRDDIDALLIIDFPADRLEDVERVWGPERQRLEARARVSGLTLEHDHWDWRRKARLNQHQFFAVEYEGEVQGLMATEIEPRPARLTPSAEIVYVDYIEVAPWNLLMPAEERHRLGASVPPGSVQRPRFMGTGTVLIAAAVKSSDLRGLKGRVGLHALPRAEPFYAGRCEMTDCGIDRYYHRLVYFEYDGVKGLEWLAKVNLL